MEKLQQGQNKQDKELENGYTKIHLYAHSIAKGLYFFKLICIFFKLRVEKQIDLFRFPNESGRIYQEGGWSR